MRAWLLATKCGEDEPLPALSKGLSISIAPKPNDVYKGLHQFAANIDLASLCSLPNAAAEMVSGFLRAPSHNLRYAGIDALARVVRVNARYAAEHQHAVIDCLEDPDDTLKGKTLELLYKMTKPGNVEVCGAVACAVVTMHGHQLT